MKKVLLCCAWSEPWISIINEVQKVTDTTVELIVAWRDDADKFREAFPSSELLIVEDMWLFGPIQESHYNNDYPVAESEKIIAHTMLKRQTSMFFEHNYEVSSFLFESFCNFWAERLTNIDLVISPSVPHRFFDYALYIVAQNLNIKVLTFQMLPFGSRVIPLNDIRKMQFAEPVRDRSNFENIIQSELGKSKLAYEAAIPDYMKHHARERKIVMMMYRTFSKVFRNLNRKDIYKFKFPNTYKIMFDNFPRNRRATWLRFILEELNKQVKLYLLKRKHAYIARKPDLNKKYILFALHYQPEETSCPSAGLYCDQLFALRTLSRLVGGDCQIYVKEHAAQFDAHQEGDRGRSKSFYNAISAMGPKIVLIDDSIDTFTLIKHSQAVSTLTGTIGWESIIRMKPVITFGRSWYEHHPDNFRVTNRTNSKDILRHISGDQQTSEWTARWLETLLTKSLHCKHYKGWLSRSDVSFEVSVRNLSSLVLEQLDDFS